jgi:DNA-binding NarL/FixJ family response regulator
MKAVSVITQISILLADDHVMLRSGLRTLFNQEPDMKVVGEADDGRAAAALAQQLHPDVVIMDITMPDLNGIESTRLILKDAPATKVIALSAHSDRRYVSEALKIGAVGYLPKSAPYDELTTAIHTVMEGRIYLSPRIANLVIEDYVRGGTREAPTAFTSLSHREREVLQLVAEGLATKEVAARLNVSIKTVETHRSRLMTKINVRGVAELTKYAIREGLTSLEV